MAIFQRLNQEAGMSIVLVIHEPEIATYARRVLSFKDSGLVRDERVEQPRTASEGLRHGVAEGRE